MLNPGALKRPRGQEVAEIMLDFIPGPKPAWPDAIEVSAATNWTRVSIRLHVDELEVLAVALDSAVAGADGELSFRPAVDRIGTERLA
jgi:hypothetical protein